MEIQDMNIRLLAVTAALAVLPVPALAHAGLDKSSKTMMLVHSLAHTLGDHPIITIALTGVLIGAYGLYHRANRSRRESD